MPVQEAVVSRPGQLAAPDGASFGPPCATKEQDIQAWNDLIPATTAELDKGRFIVALVQTRNTRPWSVQTQGYMFKAAEDYLVAAYSVSDNIGRPYAPATVLLRWLDLVKAKNDGRTQQIDADMIQMFQCSPKGCNLTSVGLMKMIKFYSADGKRTDAEALMMARGDLGNAQKFGWLGGNFPGLGDSGRKRSNAIVGRTNPMAPSQLGSPPPRPRQTGLLGDHRPSI